MTYSYEYPRPMVTVDAVVLNDCSKELRVLLIKRNNDPYKNMWALPGGFVDMDEDLYDAVVREVEEETGLSIKDFKQLASYGKPGRDPRGRNIAVVHYALLSEELIPTAGDDAGDAKWFNLSELPSLGFDHETIISDCIKKVQQCCT